MPTGDLPLFEMTLRKYERPKDNDKKTLIRRLCMSLGLIQPGDRRTGLLEIFEVLFDAKEPLKAEEIAQKLPERMALSGIRRHLRRMMALNLVERRNKRYSISESGDLVSSLKFMTKRYAVDDTFERILEYAEKLNELRQS